jgi:hypothetical protein
MSAPTEGTCRIVYPATGESGMSAGLFMGVPFACRCLLWNSHSAAQVDTRPPSPRRREIRRAGAVGGLFIRHAGSFASRGATVSDDALGKSLWMC